MLKRDELAYTEVLRIVDKVMSNDAWFLHLNRGRLHKQDGHIWFCGLDLAADLELSYASLDDLNRLCDLFLMEKLVLEKLDGRGYTGKIEYYRVLDPVEIVRKRGAKKQD